MNAFIHASSNFKICSSWWSFLVLSVVNISMSVHKCVSKLHFSLTWYCILTINFMQLLINFTAVLHFHPQIMNRCSYFQSGLYLELSRYVYNWLSEKQNCPRERRYVSQYRYMSQELLHCFIKIAFDRKFLPMYGITHLEVHLQSFRARVNNASEFFSATMCTKHSFY